MVIMRSIKTQLSNTFNNARLIMPHAEVVMTAANASKLSGQLILNIEK